MPPLSNHVVILSGVLCREGPMHSAVNCIVPSRKDRAQNDTPTVRAVDPGTMHLMIPRPMFDPGNRQPLGFTCAIPNMQRLCQRRHGPSFTLIHRDHYTTLAFLRIAMGYDATTCEVVKRQYPGSMKTRLRLRNRTIEFKSNRSKRGHTWQP